MLQSLSKAPLFEDIGAGIQLSPNAMQVLTQLNLAAPLKPYAFYPKAATMRHYQTGEIYFQSDLATATARYGTPYIHIHRADLISGSLKSGGQCQYSHISESSSHRIY